MPTRDMRSYYTIKTAGKMVGLDLRCFYRRGFGKDGNGVCLTNPDGTTREMEGDAAIQLLKEHGFFKSP